MCGAWCQGRGHGTFQRRGTGEKPDFNALDASQVAGARYRTDTAGQMGRAKVIQDDETEWG